MLEDETCQMSMFSLEDSHAKICPSRAVVRAWLASDPASGGSFIESLTSYVPAGSLSKTSLGFCRVTADGIWEPYSGHWQTSGIGGPTGCLTLSMPEWPSDGAACSLSDILETGPHLQKYCLSPTAARGILRRAEKRGKVLPSTLLEALSQLAEGGMEQSTNQME